MVDTIRKNILDDIKTQMAAIATPTFENDVKEVFLTHRTAIQTTERPAIVIHDLQGDASRRMIRDAYQHTMRLEFIGVVADPEGDERKDSMSSLLGDMREQIAKNETWAGNAIATVIEANVPSGAEGEEPFGTDRITARIIYRAKTEDPTALGLI